MAGINIKEHRFCLLVYALSSQNETYAFKCQVHLIESTARILLVNGSLKVN